MQGYVNARMIISSSVAATQVTIHKSDVGKITTGEPSPGFPAESQT